MRKNLVLLSAHSAFISAFLNFADKRPIPPHIQNATELNRSLDLLKEGYENNILQAYHYSKQHGAEFFHFLEPHIFTVKNKSKYERNLIWNYYPLPKGFELAFQKGYPELQNVNVKLSRLMNCYDLTEILNNRKNPNEEYYLDMCHVNHKAHQIIAENIFLRVNSVITGLDKGTAG